MIKKTNIAILGGGTAGWLTALLAKEFYLDANITVIESDEIGILGAGEGTVPHFIAVLDTIGIPVSDLIKECDATLKLGIRFSNWNGDGQSFFHPFYGTGDVSPHACDSGYYLKSLLETKQIALGLSLDDISFSQKLASQAKVPFVYRNDISVQDSNPILKLQSYSNFGLHFNARKLAVYLRKVAESRGIKRVEGKLSQVKNNEQGNITQLVLENSVTTDTDFVFDCSGFARLLVGKHFNTPWQSYQDYLPMKQAVPFFIPHDNKNILPETGSTAMKYGWIWQIPVQDRYGCGYVFDSDFINSDQALSEVEEALGYPVESPKTFKFDPGTYKNTVVKNCMAIGLAQSFVEPLEATSIWISCVNLIDFLQHNGINNQVDIFQTQFNERCRNRNNQVVDFLQLHYLTTRSDSEFWRTFREKNKMRDSVQERLSSWNTVAPNNNYPGDDLFFLTSWLNVSNGLGLLNRQSFQRRIDQLLIDQRMGNSFNNTLRNLDNLAKSCMTHEEFINLLLEF